MNKRVVLEIDKNLVEGEILVYKDGMLKSVEIHELLSDLLKAKNDIIAINEEIADIKQTIANLAKIVKEK